MKLKFLLFKNISTKQTVFKNTFWLMVAEVVSKVPLFFLNIWLVRYLGVENYGKFAFAFAFASLFTFLADWGLSLLTLREVAKNKNLAPKYTNNLLTLKIILAFFSFFLIFLAIPFLEKPPEVKTIIYLAGIFVIITSFTAFFQAIIQAFEKMEYLVIPKLVSALSLLGLISLMIKLNLGLKSLTSAFVYSAIITFWVTLILVRKRFTQFSLRADLVFWRQALSEAWSFGLISFLGSIYFPLRTIQVNLIAGDVETGWYHAAFQLIFILMTLVSLFFAALFPALANEYGQSKTNFYKMVDFFAQKVIFFSFVSCLLLFLASQKIIFLLYGVNYLKSVVILRFLLISIFISFVHVSFSEALKVVNLQKEYLKISFAGLLLNFLINFPLISFWGGAGASLGAIFSSALVATLMIKKFKEFKKMDLLPRQ